VHAYGYENGQLYAGYVQLTARNAAAQQALAQTPTAAQAQLAQYPVANPYTRQATALNPKPYTLINSKP
jgi:hypothetical protein